MLRVKELCKQKGISQVELAKKIGVTASALNQNITGNPSLDRLKDIAGALGVSVSDLVGDQTDRNTIVCPNCGKKFKMEE